MYYVGIDIAKSFHVVSVINDEETKVINKPFKINNDAKGFEKLLTILDSVSLDKANLLLDLKLLVFIMSPFVKTNIVINLIVIY